MLVTETGARLGNLQARPRLYDSFNRADGAVGNGWTDAASLYPTQFDAATIAGGELSIEAVTPSTYLPVGDQLVGHAFIARDVGMSDNFVVTVGWRTTGALSCLSQVSPVALVDLGAAPEEMGVLAASDVTVGGNGDVYLHNAFRSTTIADSFDPQFYTHLGDTGGDPNYFPAAHGMTWVELEVSDGDLYHRWNGVQQHSAPVSVASAAPWAVGNTWAGIHIIAIDWEVGSEYPNAQGTVTEPHPAIVTYWSARSLV